MDKTVDELIEESVKDGVYIKEYDILDSIDVCNNIQNDNYITTKEICKYIIYNKTTYIIILIFIFLIYFF